VDGPYAYLNEGLYLSSNPAVGQGGVALTFYESTGSGESTATGESAGSGASTASGARRAGPAGGQ
ncbi:MAG: hypothetical protein JXB36_07730, partial [Gammaproteobacteria bacterium]|nr:hypothetical protein [Gammaproteobacteria bacterium]